MKKTGTDFFTVFFSPFFIVLLHFLICVQQRCGLIDERVW